MARTIRQFVFDRLGDGRSVESVWREVGSSWNYVSRLAREWKAEQEALRLAVHEGKIGGSAGQGVDIK